MRYCLAGPNTDRNRHFGHYPEIMLFYILLYFSCTSILFICLLSVFRFGTLLCDNASPKENKICI